MGFDAMTSIKEESWSLELPAMRGKEKEEVVSSREEEEKEEEGNGSGIGARQKP